jgi:hypothetical protein
MNTRKLEPFSPWGINMRSLSPIFWAVSKEKVALIEQHLSPSPGADDKDARVQNFNSCFDAAN